MIHSCVFFLFIFVVVSGFSNEYVSSISYYMKTCKNLRHQQICDSQSLSNSNGINVLVTNYFDFKSSTIKAK